MPEFVSENHSDYLRLVEWLNEERTWDQSDWALWSSEGLTPHGGVPTSNRLPGQFQVHTVPNRSPRWNWQWQLGCNPDTYHIRLVDRICLEMNESMHPRSNAAEWSWMVFPDWVPNRYSRRRRRIWAVTGCGYAVEKRQPRVRRLLIRLSNRIKAALAIRNPFSCKIEELLS